ncbi:MAG: hypothetical protein RMJ45_04035 [Candidatus Calescibacterium sp.]|nr:hypothetical protein [Candidatus Calescibacterium sp.]
MTLVCFIADVVYFTESRTERAVFNALVEESTDLFVISPFLSVLQAKINKTATPRDILDTILQHNLHPPLSMPKDYV